MKRGKFSGKVNQPNLQDWAEALYYGMLNGTNKEKTLTWLELELTDIADKYYQMGFWDGDKNGWWKAQDEEIELNRSVAQKVIKNLKEEFPNGFADWELPI